jgi:hypothetical protein
MLDRQKLETILSRRFNGAAREQIAAAANAIMGLGEEWEEVDSQEHEELGYHFSVQCNDICSLARQAAQGTEFRLLRRRAN